MPLILSIRGVVCLWAGSMLWLNSRNNIYRMALPDQEYIPVQIWGWENHSERAVKMMTSNEHCLTVTAEGTATLFNNTGDVVWREPAEYLLLYDSTIVRKMVGGACTLISGSVVTPLPDIKDHWQLWDSSGDVIVTATYLYYNVKTRLFEDDDPPLVDREVSGRYSIVLRERGVDIWLDAPFDEGSQANVEAVAAQLIAYLDARGG
jgi:hypothetical protein